MRERVVFAVTKCPEQASGALAHRCKPCVLGSALKLRFILKPTYFSDGNQWLEAHRTIRNNCRTREQEIDVRTWWAARPWSTTRRCTSAIVPERPSDANLGAAGQARQMLARLDARLAKLGSSKSKVMFVTIVLADMASYDEINRVWDNWTDKEAPPSRACISAKLASPAMKIEIIIQAAVTK